MTTPDTFTILTVCTGNICRSPLAAQLLTLATVEWGAVDVRSAGTHALVGHPMPDEAQSQARHYGAPHPETHRASQLDVAALQAADLVLTASREHRKTVVETHPRAIRTTFTMREMARLLRELDSEPLDLTGATTAERLREITGHAASQRGQGQPPRDPEDDDIIDPYRREASIYQLSAEQTVAALTDIFRGLHRAVL